MGDALNNIASQAFVAAADPVFEAIKGKVMEAVGPATERAASSLRPYIEQTLRTTVLPELVTWGGFFLVVSVALGAIVGSVVAARHMRSRSYRMNGPRPRRRHAA